MKCRATAACIFSIFLLKPMVSRVNRRIDMRMGLIMNFRRATDVLLEAITLDDLAKAMGVSLQALRQTRANPETTAHRPPPTGWEAAIAALAKRRSADYKRLAQVVGEKSA